VERKTNTNLAFFSVPFKGWEILVQNCKVREKAPFIVYVTLHKLCLQEIWQGKVREDDYGRAWFAITDRRLARESNLAKKTIEPAIKKLVDLDLILANRVPKSCSEYHLKLTTPSTQIVKKPGTSGTTPGDHYIKNINNKSNNDFISTKY
jgi:hypothetical protein